METAKKDYDKATDQHLFNSALKKARPLEKEKLSFGKANSLTRSLTAKANRESNDPSHGQFLAAVEIISIILGEIRENLSDPDYGNLESAHAALERANLDNLAVARRMADRNLYIGLLGEFSCGKSTFINALLEEKFLHEDVLQGTTCAKTVVSYAPRENIRVIFDNNTYMDLQVERNQVLIEPEMKRNFIRIMTADETRAASIREVVCQMPNQVLANGLSIVDTPGIGSTNPRHIEVTRDAVHSCDAVLVLTTLDKPLSAELIDNVKKLVGEDAPNCLFIGTRKDQLQKKELPRQARHFQKKLRSSFGRECQFEFVSAYMAMEELAGAATPDNSLKAFREFRSKLKSLLENNRRLIQARKTRLLIDAIISDLTASFESRKEEFSKQIARYQEDAIPRDSRKWAAWQKEMEKIFFASLKEIELSYRENSENLAQEIYDKIRSEIMECDDTSELKNYLASGINSTLASFNRQIETSTVNFIYKPMQKALKSCLQAYNEKFMKEYDKIENIFGIPLPKQVSLRNDRVLQVNTRASSAGYDSLAAEMETEENIKMGGGLATGIGVSLLVPGVGWLVGGTLAVLGLVLGAGLMKSLEKRKEEALEKVAESIYKFQSQYFSDLDSAWATLVPQFKNAFTRSIKAQKDEYDRIIENHNNFLENLSGKMAKSSAFVSDKLGMLKNIGEAMRQIAPEQYFIFTEEENEAGD